MLTSPDTNVAVDPALTPAQARAHEDVLALIGAAPVIALAGMVSTGRTTILKSIAAARGGTYLSAADIVGNIEDVPADRTDAAVGRLLDRALDGTDLLILDDPDAITFRTAVTRSGYLGAVVLAHIFRRARNEQRTVIISGGLWGPGLSAAQVYGPDIAAIGVTGFTAEDYATIVGNVIGADKAAGIDFRLVFRSASMLNAGQLVRAAQALERVDAPNAGQVIATLQLLGITADNVRTAQVEAIDFARLPGHEAIVQRLMTHIVIPMEHHALAERLKLKPKRGVLLYGPPGTGKTSVGRALAHRMQGKFFMIDGSFISEPPGEFFAKINAVIEEAKRHSPSLLFIDDADVLFGLNHIAGLSRLLLSLLDGLESETASNVCVMMTAMDVRDVPEALLRSGRVELWLETKLPPALTRADILKRWLSGSLPGSESSDYSAMAARTALFTPADLRRVANDAKALYAADVVRGRPERDATAYGLAAIDAMIELREKMAVNLADDRLRLRETGRGGTAGYAAGLGGMAATGSGGGEPGW